MSRDPKSFNPGDKQVHKAVDDLADVYSVVDDILLSLCSRSGIGDAIEGCDEEIKQEIRSDLAKIIEAFRLRVEDDALALVISARAFSLSLKDTAWTPMTGSV